MKYNYRFGLNFVNAMIIVNKEAFDALTPDTQAKLRRIVAEVTPWTMATMQHEEAELTDKMAAGGVIVTQAKPEDLAEAGPRWSRTGTSGAKAQATTRWRR